MQLISRYVLNTVVSKNTIFISKDQPSLRYVTFFELSYMVRGSQFNDKKKHH
jgi:hypothetical protein